MLTKSISRKPGQVLAVLAAVTSLSGLAEAQQSGLFPLHPIRRERTPCANEEPIYKLYREQYYGYFPTRWRRFPDGWALRSPEGPNTKEELKKNPIEGPKPYSGEGEGEEMPGPAAPGGKPAIPNPPPEERSPFEMDKPDNGGVRHRDEGTPRRGATRLHRQQRHRRSTPPRPTRPGLVPRPKVGRRLHSRTGARRRRFPIRALPTWLRQAMPPLHRLELRGTSVGVKAERKIPDRF